MTTGFDIMFECAPTSFWLEDLSGVHALLGTWRASGVTDLRRHLLEDPARVRQCSDRVRVLRVNRRTLQLYEADDLDHLVAHLGQVFGDPVASPMLDELDSMFRGEPGFASQAVNFTLGGRRLDVLVNGRVLPGHEARWDRVLISIEDISARTRAEARLRDSERYARGIFEHSPVSLWVEDFSRIKVLLDDLRAAGVDDFRAYLQGHGEFTLRCLRAIRVVDVNRHTLELFHADSKATLLANLDQIFRSEMQSSFTECLIGLWRGELTQQREVVNYGLDDQPIDALLHFSVLPGAEHDWGLVHVALIDIRARKRTEARLEYLGTHDALTGLRNRAFLEDELKRIEREGPWPVASIAIDVNGLKETNDARGHAAGDALLRRAGAVLAEATEAPNRAVRVGGDEFVVLMPGHDQAAGERLIERILALVERDNRSRTDTLLSLSMGCACSRPGERLETVLGRADERMYADKSRYYAAAGHDRRGAAADARSGGAGDAPDLGGTTP